MKIPDNLLSLLTLAGNAGSRPLDALAQGKPSEKGREAAAKLTVKDLGTSKSPETLLFLQSALYIYFDCSDEAHKIAQDHENAIGNWLHAILHRREPDAANSKYWYQRVEAAKAYQTIGSRVLGMLLGQEIMELEILGARIARAKTWQPEVFVDLCEKSREKDPKSEVYQGLAKIQEIEWRGLVEFILEP